MNLYLHLSIHFFSSLLAGFIAWRILRQKPWWAFFGGILGGFLVDIDHWIDYFLAFGKQISLNYFFHSYQFLKNDQMFIFFHGWEYVAVFFAIAFIVKNKTAKMILLAMAIGLFFHLGADMAINQISFKTYSVLYRASKNFMTEKLVTPDQYRYHLKFKKAAGF